ncbi:MDR family MFS transporter [Paenibacillus pini]|uniref:Major facilitator family transporter n=1 Tax=Paenibacillus pini JCM 16418 TaxID=1236976 RepID=W7YQQ6_9BACL|nr:MFS transporter [Paenibacillus pini]GAF06931.1 major facilitator family transporter [Paenibacillus pini JCM 16418]
MRNGNKRDTFLRRYDIAIWIRILGNALNAMTTFIIRPFLAIYLYDKLGGSLVSAMLVIGLQPFAAMLTGIFGGGLSDRFGRKPVMITAVLIQVLGLGAYTMADSVWAFAIITAVMGVGSALFAPAANAMISDVVEPKQQTEVFALLHTASNVGAAFGPAIGLLLFQWNSTIVFLTSAVILLVYLLLVFLKVPESLHRIVNQGQHEPVVQASGRFMDHKILYGMTLLAMPIGLIYALVISILPFHLSDHFMRAADILASLMTFNGILVIGLQLWLTNKTQHMLAYRIIGISYALYAAVAFGYGFSRYIALLFIVEFIFSIGEMLVGPQLQKEISELAPEGKRGFYFSIFGLHMQLPLAFGPVIGGLIYTSWKGTVMFMLLGVLFALSGAAQFILIRWLRKRRMKDSHVDSNVRIKRKEESLSI